MKVILSVWRFSKWRGPGSFHPGAPIKYHFQLNREESAQFPLKNRHRDERVDRLYQQLVETRVDIKEIKEEIRDLDKDLKELQAREIRICGQLNDLLR